MFISLSRPLAKARLRLPDGREFELDESGQVDIDLEAGTHTVEVYIDDEDEWVSTHVEVTDDDAMRVVDIDAGESQSGLVGQVLGGRYHIEAALGQGGMGVVYRARDTRLERDVAIKTLNAQFQDNDEASRLFLQEARQMAPLSHPHLVAIHDVATLEGHDLMITELVEGHNLDELVDAQGPLGINDALIVAYQLSVAVAFLHDQEMIHRDLKPANAILEAGGGVKLIDFGLARSLDHLMAKGTAVRGTPAYMAPEQVLGPKLSSATDVYQLGATFYELLTGELPISVEEGNMLAHVKAPVVPIDERRTLPPKLVAVVHECLEKQPEDRPTTDEVADRLAAMYHERTDRPPPASITGTWQPADPRERDDDGAPSKASSEEAFRDTMDDPQTEKDEPSAANDESSVDDSPSAGAVESLDSIERDAADDEAELKRPVKKYTIVVGIVTVVVVALVVGHFYLVERPRLEQADEQPTGTSVPDDADDEPNGEDAMAAARVLVDDSAQIAERLAENAAADASPDTEPSDEDPPEETTPSPHEPTGAAGTSQEGAVADEPRERPDDTDDARVEEAADVEDDDAVGEDIAPPGEPDSPADEDDEPGEPDEIAEAESPKESDEEGEVVDEPVEADEPEEPEEPEPVDEPEEPEPVDEPEEPEETEEEDEEADEDEQDEPPQAPAGF